jgi:hypothetical protein
MSSIVDKVEQNDYRTGRALQMYIEAIRKARSLSPPLPIPKKGKESWLATDWLQFTASRSMPTRHQTQLPWGTTMLVD